MESIQEVYVKIKGRREQVLLLAVVSVSLIIIAIIGFILGRVSVTNENKNSIYIEYPPLVNQYTREVTTGLNEGIKPQNSVQPYVASVNGSKYYPLDCVGVARIKDENKIYFITVEEAQNAGYEASANCS